MNATLVPDRAAWRAAVADIAAKAHEKLPACHGRIDSAVKLVLAGDVELLSDGTARVASRSDGHLSYQLVNGRCECRDFSRAPGQLCAHRLAYGIARRAAEMGPTPAEPLLLPPLLPEAPASANCHIMLEGRQVMITLRDTDEGRLLLRLAAVLQQYPAPAQPSTKSTKHEEKGTWCAIHQVAMTLTQKNGRSWYSHKTDQGWCKGK